MIDRLHGGSRFWAREPSTSKFSKSVNSFGPTVFFPKFSRIWLSFGGVKSENEFAAPDLAWTKLRVMVAENFGKSKIQWKVEDPGRFRALNRPGVLAGANFIALRRASFHIT